MIRVAGYCRVSTDTEDQRNSFESQCSFFAEYIQRNIDWEFYKIYADEGVTGTSTRKREQFLQMIQDARCGAFQLILTKEVSRFSRNILDVISYTRELKALGVGVIFLSDGFCSLDADAELRLSIMGSIAQEESRKTSTRVKWGQTRQMERGVVFGNSLLGYDLHGGKLIINPEGGALVKRIFHMYGIEKKGTTQIAKILEQEGQLTSRGNATWHSSHILKILKNEKYVGDLVQKKTFTPDYLTHAKKLNRGQEKMIVLRDHHPGIITRVLWDTVQNEISNRNRHKRSRKNRSNRYAFSGKIICAECGACFVARMKTRKDGSDYRVWRCSTAAYQGASQGCGIGRQMSDVLATDILKHILSALPIDREGIVKRIETIPYKKTWDNTEIYNKIENIKAKKDKAIDAHLSGLLAENELQRMKMRYDSQIKTLEAERNWEYTPQRSEERELIFSILRGESDDGAFFASILESMHLHKNGLLEVKLKHLPVIWQYQLAPATADI